MSTMDCVVCYSGGWVANSSTVLAFSISVSVVLSSPSSLPSLDLLKVAYRQNCRRTCVGRRLVILVWYSALLQRQLTPCSSPGCLYDFQAPGCHELLFFEHLLSFSNLDRPGLSYWFINFGSINHCFQFSWSMVVAYCSFSSPIGQGFRFSESWSQGLFASAAQPASISFWTCSWQREITALMLTFVVTNFSPSRWHLWSSTQESLTVKMDYCFRLGSAPMSLVARLFAFSWYPAWSIFVWASLPQSTFSQFRFRRRICMSLCHDFSFQLICFLEMSSWPT